MINKENNQAIKNFVRKFENKRCFILTTFNIRYLAKDLKVLEEHISFEDKFGDFILLAISEIKQIKGVSNGF